MGTLDDGGELAGMAGEDVRATVLRLAPPALDGHGLRCYTQGCSNMPNCDQVLQRVNSNATLARNIYYILQSFHSLNLIAGVVSVSYL